METLVAVATQPRKACFCSSERGVPACRIALARFMDMVTSILARFLRRGLAATWARMGGMLLSESRVPVLATARLPRVPWTTAFFPLEGVIRGAMGMALAMDKASSTEMEGVDSMIFWA
jgi:hypothetical protein